MPTSGQFQLNAPFPPKGDQPQAIEKLIQGVRDGLAHQVLLGATGTGKTYTACNVIARLQRPTLVIAHNKTLAAQLCQEIKEFFPENAVEYFVSYYDYYQPEAYVPHTDTFIEKESSRNDEIDRLRHSTTQSVTSRRDVVVVSSVSCIYGLGTPELYQKNILDLRVGMTIDRRETLAKLIHMQFARNDVNLVRGTHFIADEDRMEGALKQIERDLEEQVEYFHGQGKILEAQRLQQRVRYDMEMMCEVGYCNGIENYSRYLDGRAPGAPPFTLLNYFPKDFLLIVDESHQTMPQIRAMYAGDRSRKEVLIEYGFRLPAAFDNRPLKFEEFEERVGQTIFTSATPGPYELEHIGLERKTVDDSETKRAKTAPLPFELPTGDYPGLAQQIIRPTGLIDPEIIIRPTRGQIDDLLSEIRNRTAKNQRVLVATLTKRMAEDLSEYLKELKVKVNYLHSDVITMERSTTLRELRQGKYSV